MCFVCLENESEYICSNCKSTDTTVCMQCYRDTLRCPFCKCVLHKKWLVNITFTTIIELYKSLNMYKLKQPSKYNIDDLSIIESEKLILGIDRYIRHYFDSLPCKSQNIVRIVRSKISTHISKLSFTHRYPVPMLRDPYQTLPSE